MVVVPGCRAGYTHTEARQNVRHSIPIPHP
jgi:hypothetical protein